jgi:hypothetical protein
MLLSERRTILSQICLFKDNIVTRMSDYRRDLNW